MTRPDLFELAQSNEAALPRRLDERLANAPADTCARVAAFCECVEKYGAISVNMSMRKLRDFLDAGEYRNPHEVSALWAAEAPGRTAEDRLRELEGSYYDRRIAFDRHFVDGEHFRYGAMNVGGLGVLYYGKFCVVFSAQTLESWRTAFLPGNSLELYVRMPPDVDERTLSQDIAPASQRHRLAALKHLEDLSCRAEPEWACMLCSHDSFVEAVFVGTAAVEHVGEIRVEAQEAVRLQDLAFDSRSTQLDPADENEADVYRRVLEAIRERGLNARYREVSP